MGNTQAEGDEAPSLSRPRSILSNMKRSGRSLPIPDTEAPPDITSPISSNFEYRDDAELLDLVLDEVVCTFILYICSMIQRWRVHCVVSFVFVCVSALFFCPLQLSDCHNCSGYFL